MSPKCFFSQALRDGLTFKIQSMKDADPFIWKEAFEDDFTEIKSAVQKLENCGFCAALIQNYTVLSQFIGLETRFNEKKGIYIYALCTNSLYRNKGYMRRLLELSFEYGKLAGYDYFWLFPASEDLKASYNKIGFTVKIPVGASPLPTEENDFYNVIDPNNCDNEISFSLFDGNYELLYSFSDKVFDRDAFEYSLKGIAKLVEIKYINERGKTTGYIILSKSFPGKVLCVSSRYSYFTKSIKKEFAYLYPLSFSNYAKIFSAEPLPR